MLAVLLLGQAMASLDGSIVAVAAPTIRAGLRASGADVQLIVSGYLLTTGVLFVTCARLGDVLGHRRTFLAGLGWFTLASLLCGLAVTPTMLVLTRLVQAMGAALLMPQVFSLIHRHWEGTERRRAIGAYSAILALGVVLGQVGGGLVVGADLLGLSWRPVFLVNVPIGLTALAVGARVLPGARAEGRARLDVPGVLLLTVAMTAIILPLTVGHDRHWPAWTWSVLVAGVVLLGLFGRHERRASHPLLDPAALRPPVARFGMPACCLVMGCYAVFLLTFTLHLQSRLGESPLEAGITFVPFAVGFGVLSLTWTSLPDGLQRCLPVVGPMVFAVGSVVAVLLCREQRPPIGAAAVLFLAGAGHAAGYSPLIARITSRVDSRLASAISALNATGPTLAEVMAVAGLGTVYFGAPSSADGLLRVAAAVALLLAVASACAALALRSHGRGAPAQETGPA